MDKEYFIELNEVKNRGTWSEQAAVLNDNFRKIQVAEAAVEELAEEVEGYKTLLDSKSMEIGATAFDAIPTKGSVNPVTSDGLHRTTVMAERVIGNPAGDWNKGTAEAYIDKEIVKVKNWVSNTPVTDVVIVETLPSSGKMNTLYRVKGTNAYSEYGWDGSKFVPLAVKEYGIDDEPTAGSENLVRSGGVKKVLSELDSKVEDNKAKISEIYRNEKPSDYDDLAQAAYYSGSGIYTTESYNAYSVAYYSVNNGDIIIVKGVETGANVAAISLVGNKGEKAIESFDISKEVGVSITVYRHLVIPEGVNYVALSVGYTNPYRLSLYKVGTESRLDRVIEKSVRTNNKTNSVLATSNFIMPSTSEDNLLFNDKVYLNLSKAKEGLFVLEDNPVSTFVMTRLICVKPNTTYTIAKVTEFFEWDEDFNIVNTILVNPGGYDLHVFTTSEKTAYISIKARLSSYGDDYNTDSLQEGTHTEPLNRLDKILNIEKFNGVPAEFAINQEGRNLINRDNLELYRGNKLVEYSFTANKYYNKNLSFSLDSYGNFSTQFYEVNEGDVILVKGKALGTGISVISLVESVDAEYAIRSILSHNSNSEFSRIELAFIIPTGRGVRYVAVSSNSKDNISLYKKDLNISCKSRLDKHDDEFNSVKEKFLYKNYEKLTEGEIEKGHYYGSNGNYLTDSYGAFNIKYYPVIEGQRIRLFGKYRGNIYAFVLLEQKRGTAMYKYGKSTSVSEYSEIDETIIIPSGINWIAMSYVSDSDSAPYIESRVDYLEFLKGKVTELENQSQANVWKGKRLLAIGDSITAQNLWQKKSGELLGMNVRTHAKGGIGIIQMVDGDGSGDAPEGYDPDTFGTSTIYRLNTEDVSDVDLIILMGFYNTRSAAKSNRGELTDMYPEQDTWYGQMNYAIKRVYEELEKAGNYNCKVVICSAHKYGKYPYSNESAYNDGHILLEATRAIANRHSLFLIDLMNNGNINMYNWGKFQSSSTSYATNYIPSDGVNDGTNKPFASLDAAPLASANTNKYITVSGVSGCYKSDGNTWVKLSSPNYPWNGDQLHLGKEGGYRLGEYIAGQLTTI